MSIFLAAILAMPQAAYPNVSVGDTWVGESRYLFSASDDQRETDLYVWKEDWKVVSVAANGVVLDCGRVLSENRANGQLVPVGADIKPMRWKETWSVSGVYRSPLWEDPSSYRLWRMRLIPPHNTPWKWDPSPSWPAARASVKSSSMRVWDSRPTSVVSGSYAEDSGITATWKGERDVASGWVIQADMDAKGVMMEGGSGQNYNLHLSWKTIKLQVADRE